MYLNKFHLSICFCVWLGLVLPVRGQENNFPANQITLTNLSPFKAAAPNWQLASDVYFDMQKGSNPKLTAGTGVLVQNAGKGKSEPLFTTLEHGDLELELDFMVAKGANTGIFLQGRYEVALADSWGEQNPKATDAGGIGQRWNENRPEGQKGYEGHAPIQNVSKAPGLWQHANIIFRAPRFNQQGQKTENARLIKVILNGVVVQENVVITGPTQGAAFPDEKPTGPLMLEAGQGAVAFRNLAYRSYGTEQVTLSGLKLQSYEADIRNLTDFSKFSPRAEMDVDVLAHLAPASRDKFAGKILGTIHIPVTGEYFFNLNLAWIPQDTNPNWINGAGQLTIGGKEVLTVTGRTGIASGKVNLPKGDYPLELIYFKSSAYWYARSNDITLSVGGPGVAYNVLNTPLRAEDPVGAITVMARNEPVMLRGFVEHQGQKKTHVISVGEPGGANYTYDLRRGDFLQIWRGNFIEATPMWHGRGETQLAVPLGSVISLPGKPSLAFLADKNTAWPDSNAAYTYLGYDVNPAGRPIFKYALGGATVREAFASEEGGRKLTHSFTVMPGQEEKEIWCRVATGRDITKLPNGLYAVNGKEYYIELPGKIKPLIRSTGQNTTEMLLPVKAKSNVGSVNYAIIW